VRLWGIAAGLAAAGIWGGMYVVSKVVLDVIPPFALITLRLALGGACLALVAWAGGGVKASGRQIRRVLAVGIVGYGVSIGLQFIGTKLSNAANASLVTTASPAFIFLFGVWILKERATWPGVLGLVMAGLGVVAIIDPGGARLGGDTMLWGNLALVGAAVTWALYSVLVKVVSRDMDSLGVSLYAFLGGLPISIPGALIEVSTGGFGRITGGVVWGVLYLGVVSTALAMYLWNKSLALLDAGLVALLFFAQPVVGAGLGAWLLGEALTPGFWLGSALIGAGLVLAAWGTPSSPMASDRRSQPSQGVLE
jgi:drug/metabolite transporter (DMT)-like permease